MSFIEKKEDDILIINVNGDVDLENSDSLREQVSTALESNSAVSVNMSEVSYIDSSGIAALIESRQKAEEANKSFKIQKPSEAVISVLKMAKLDTFFVIEN
ncbi:STAS domain-containing protein [Candidatus Pelagibacter sp. HIMB1509]|uniref:STAS domain-containing protein n=1 Tax=Candidatus Pelagibacter sp. HIMB1509 TaxID=3413339 RepID=UPI003F859C15